MRYNRRSAAVHTNCNFCHWEIIQNWSRLAKSFPLGLQIHQIRTCSRSCCLSKLLPEGAMFGNAINCHLSLWAEKGHLELDGMLLGAVGSMMEDEPGDFFVVPVCSLALSIESPLKADYYIVLFHYHPTYLVKSSSQWISNLAFYETNLKVKFNECRLVIYRSKECQKKFLMLNHGWPNTSARRKSWKSKWPSTSSTLTLEAPSIQSVPFDIYRTERGHSIFGNWGQSSSCLPDDRIVGLRWQWLNRVRLILCNDDP